MSRSRREEWGDETPEARENRLLAFQVIEEAESLRGHGIARWLVKYVFTAETYGIDELHPSTEYLCEKYNEETGGNCSVKTMQDEISWAKRSQFIATTGRGKNRTFELNLGFLTDRMAEAKGLRLKRQMEREKTRLMLQRKFGTQELVQEETQEEVQEETQEFEGQNNRGNFTPNSNSNSESNTNKYATNEQAFKPKKASGLLKAFESEFNELWKLYPNKKGKAPALKAYIKARRSGEEFEVIKKGVLAYKEQVEHERTPKRYMAHGSTWFNQHRWLDEYESLQTANGNVEEWDPFDGHPTGL